MGTVISAGALLELGFGLDGSPTTSCTLDAGLIIESSVVAASFTMLVGGSTVSGPGPVGAGVPVTVLGWIGDPETG